MTTLTVTLPKLVSFEDYHQFGYFEHTLREFTGNKRIRVAEVGFDENTGLYVGVAYMGKITKREIANLLRNTSVEIA